MKPIVALEPGTRLGPYEIVGPIGAGGMGEVYRAKDTRLGRDVAIKVLPADVAGDPERLVRFQREARLVSSLNHPHIVTLYEVGTSDAGPYLVLESIEGRSLRELLQAGPVPVRQLLTIGAQVADGLAKAHAAGIVHRDLKPENVMVTADGFAKILDFGLAKMIWPEFDAGGIDEATTVAKDTASGMILGTLGYLSPEQAAGKPADYRADQFALGALLYELATRERPFRRATMLESLAATIRDEPEPLRSKRSDLPAQFEWLVERCLAKDPNDRYASTKDLARDLADLRDHLSDLTRRQPVDAAAVAGRSRSRRWLPWVLAPIVLAGVAIGAFVAGTRRVPDQTPPSYLPLTFQRGVITGARFSPDGKTVYYSAAFGSDPSRVFVTHLGNPESQPLNKMPNGFLMSVSNRDELALVLSDERNGGTTDGTLAVVPALGGTPRRIREGVSFADWAPDGDRMAVVHGNDVEFPLGRRLAEGYMVRVSPLGTRIAVLGDDVRIMDAEGNTLASADVSFAYGLAWAPDGQEVWFTASDRGGGYDRALYALSLDGRRRLIARIPGAMTVYDVAHDGKSALISTGAGWVSISAVVDGRPGEQPLDLFGRSDIMGLSADGKLVLINERREVGLGTYIRSTDGTQEIPLSRDVACGLSPKGDWALVHPRGDPFHASLLPTGPGAPRELPLEDKLGLDCGWPAQWSADGTRLFALLRAADPPALRVYMRQGDQPWHAVTPDGKDGIFAASPDGRFVAIADESGIVHLFPTGGGSPQRLEGERGYPIGWTGSGRQLILAARMDVPARIYRRDVTTGRVDAPRDIAPADRSGVIQVAHVFFSRDERTYVFQYARASQELFLAQGLK
jgi:dipeptidyl aminopeptidase/acylaminoacyl peptidase